MFSHYLVFFFFNDTALSDIYFFFLMIRRPPRSTLFPTRRSSDLLPSAPKHVLLYMYLGWKDSMPKFIHIDRKSTSELQSRSDLVCRLLLEKKKKKYTNQPRVE